MPKFKGQLEKGNLDPNNRQIILNPDGSYSTMVTHGINDEGKEVIIPSAFNGRINSPMETVQHYRQTGEHFGKFDTPENADAFDKDMHNRMYADSKLKQVTGDPDAMTPQFEELARFLREHSND